MYRCTMPQSVLLSFFLSINRKRYILLFLQPLPEEQAFLFLDHPIMLLVLNWSNLRTPVFCMYSSYTNRWHIWVHSYLISEQMIYKCRARVAITTDCNPFINTVCMDGKNIIQLITHSSRPKIEEWQLEQQRMLCTFLKMLK